MFKKYLLYLALFFLPLQTRWIFHSGLLNGGAWEYGNFSLYASDILIIAAFLASLYSAIKTNSRPHKTFSYWLSWALGILLLILIPLSISPAISAFKIGTLVIAAMLAYSISTSTATLRSNALTVMLGAAVSGLLGIWQFLNQSTLASTLFGLASHDSATLGSSVVEAIAPDGVIERWLRAYGSLDHPNMFGGLMAVGLIIASWLWLSRQDKKNSLEYIAIIVSTVVLSTGLIFSFSRASWLAAAVGLTWLLIYQIIYKKIQLKEAAAWLGTLIIVGALISSQYYYLFTPRFSGDTRLEQISEHERIDAASQSFTLISNHPLLGSGLGTYTLDAAEHTKAKQPSWFFQPVHNIFLLLISEIGIIGFMLLLVMLSLCLWNLYKRIASGEAVLLFVLMVPLLIIGLFDHWPISLHFGPLLCAAVLGLAANQAKHESLT